MSATLSATIRMYRLNELGDCFLVTFARGASRSRVLIDCGSFRNSKASVARLEVVTRDLVSTLNGAPLDVVVGTHQHNDHLSGFVHCEPTFRNQVSVSKVWLSWLDDPQDGLARQIGDQFNNVVNALHGARGKLQSVIGSRRGSHILSRVDDVLGFYGAHGAKTPPLIPRQAVDILRNLGNGKPKYLRPGEIFDLPGFDDEVRVYVLGPPQDKKELFDKDPDAGESYDKHLARMSASTKRFFDAVNAQSGERSAEEVHFPFTESLKERKRPPASSPLSHMMERYRKRTDAWRNIDDEWLSQAEGLALYMDKFTNNSSLVLAFELVASGKVLLFAADAQTGNWASWSDVTWEKNGVSADDLLSRTVFYKVGHHASHNATLVAAFEKMNHPDLIAFVPVHKNDPNITKKNGWKMPARNLFKKLKAHTANRVLQMDGVHTAACDPTKKPAKQSWAKIKVKPVITKTYIEVTIKGDQ